MRKGRRYMHGRSGDEVVGWYESVGGWTRRYLVPDNQGSIIGVVDTSGNLMQANTYDEYGVPGGSNLGRFQYTGQAFMPEIGLYNDKARMYAPSLGRFMQTDPIGYGDGMNGYTYAHSDPVNGTDPTGTDSFDFGIDDGFGDYGYENGPVGNCFFTGGEDSLLGDGGRDGSDGGNGGGLPTRGPGHGVPPQNKFTIVHGTPPGAITCSAEGMTFLAPPGFNLGNISAAGRAGGLSLGAMNGAVGQYGSFDFQRSSSGGNTTYHPAYQVASNVAVGAYLNGTSISEYYPMQIEDTFAFFKSSNAGNGDQTMGQEIGWDAASGAASLSCGGSGK